jgi:WD40 repeat protein
MQGEGMAGNIEPLENSPEDQKKVISTDEAKIDGDVHGPVLNNPVFNADVQFGDRYVQAEAKPRETQGLYGVPELPRAFIPRPEYLTAIKDALLSEESNTVGITGKTLRVGLQGMGGIGKTTLAVALAHDLEVQKNFPQGIFWITLGQQPKILNAQAELANLLETNSHAFITVSDGTKQLERLLRDRCCLLILDDVWQSDHADLFNCIDAQAQARLLITTRNQEILNNLGAQSQTLDVLDTKQALALLAKWAKVKIPDLPDEAKEVADECGNLPLALAMAGAMASQKSWRHALERLRRADFDRIEKAFPYAYPNLLRALQASLDDLDESEILVKLQAHKHYLELAVFPEDSPIPILVLETLCRSESPKFDDLDFDDLLASLKSRALVQQDSEGRVRLHDLQRDFIVHLANGEQPLAERQAAFIKAYRSKISQEQWHTLPDDGYIYQHLAWHMVQAGQIEELSRLLLDFDWLQAKLNKTDIIALLHDYDIILEHRTDLSTPVVYALEIVQDSLRLSTHLFLQDKSQLAGQLLWKLLSFKSTKIQAMLAQINNHKNDRPWLRPLITTLHPPGGAEIFTLEGHDGPVDAVALTPDGRLAVSGSVDRTLKVWDLTRPDAPPRTLTGHKGVVLAVALTPDGRLAVSGSGDGTLKVWDLTRPDARPRTLAGHKDTVYAVALTPDGRLAVSGSEDRTLKVWDLTRPDAPPQTLSGHEDKVVAVALTPDGRLVVSGSWDRTLKVWDLTRPDAPPRSLTGHKDGAYAVALTPDGRLVVSGSGDGTLKVWDLTRPDAPPQTLSGHEDSVRAVALTPDGRLAVSGSGDRTLKVWDLTRPDAPPRTLSEYEYDVLAVALTPDGRLAVSGSRDRTLKVWDLTRPDAPPQTLTGHKDRVYAVALTPDGRLAVSGSGDRTLKVWDLTRPDAPPQTLSGHENKVVAVALTPDGRLVVSGSWDRTLKVWDLTRPDAPPQTLSGHQGLVGAVALTPDGRLAVSGSVDRTLKVWDLTRPDAPPQTLTGHKNEVGAVALTPDGRLAVSGSWDRTLKVWDLTRPDARPRTLAGHKDTVYAVALTPDGRLAVSESWDRTLKVWDLTRPDAPPQTLSGHQGLVGAVALTPDGRLMVSGSGDGTLKVWDLTRPDAPPQTLTGHKNEVGAVALTPDGRLAVSGSWDRTLKVWDIIKNRLLSSFSVESSISKVAISDDSQLIFAGGETGEVYIFHLEGLDNVLE